MSIQWVQLVVSQTFISDLRYIAVLARNNFHYQLQSITDRKRTVSVVNKLRYFFLRSFAVFIGRLRFYRLIFICTEFMSEFLILWATSVWYSSGLRYQNFRYFVYSTSARLAIFWSLFCITAHLLNIFLFFGGEHFCPHFSSIYNKIYLSFAIFRRLPYFCWKKPYFGKCKDSLERVYGFSRKELDLLFHSPILPILVFSIKVWECASYSK